MSFSCSFVFCYSDTFKSLVQEESIEEDCKSCFSVWKIDSDGYNQVITQGCWSVALNCIQDDQCVHDPKLLSTHESKWSNFSICCCRGPMCNENLVTKIFTKVDEEVTIPTLVLIAFSLVAIMLAVAISLFYAAKHRKWRRKAEKKNCLENVPDDCARMEIGKICVSSKEKLLSNGSNVIREPTLNLNNFMLDGVLSEETLATVVHHLKRRQRRQSGGDVHGPAEVAGKKFKSSQIQRFRKETKVYQLLNELDYASFFMHWYGSYENETSSVSDLDKELLICLELAPLGPLSLFLTANTLDWLQLSRMLLDISRGIGRSNY